MSQVLVENSDIEESQQSETTTTTETDKASATKDTGTTATETPVTPEIGESSVMEEALQHEPTTPAQMETTPVTKGKCITLCTRKCCKGEGAGKRDILPTFNYHIRPVPMAYLRSLEEKLKSLNAGKLPAYFYRVSTRSSLTRTDYRTHLIAGDPTLVMRDDSELNNIVDVHFKWISQQLSPLISLWGDLGTAEKWGQITWRRGLLHKWTGQILKIPVGALRDQEKVILPAEQVAKPFNIKDKHESWTAHEYFVPYQISLDDPRVEVKQCLFSAADDEERGRSQLDRIRSTQWTMKLSDFLGKHEEHGTEPTQVIPAYRTNDSDEGHLVNHKKKCVVKKRKLDEILPKTARIPKTKKKTKVVE